MKLTAIKYQRKVEGWVVGKGGYTQKGEQNGSVLLTNKRCTEQLERTRFLPYKIYGPHSKYRPNFECGDGETIYSFHLYNLPMKA